MYLLTGNKRAGAVDVLSAGDGAARRQHPESMTAAGISSHRSPFPKKNRNARRPRFRPEGIIPEYRTLL